MLLDWEQVHINWTLFLPFFFLSAFYFLRPRKTLSRPTETKSESEFPKEIKTNAVLPDFKWDHKEPAKSYPFKDKEYKLTMGIRSFKPDDWLLIEDTYLDRIEEKTKLITNSHPAYDSDKDTEASTVFTSEVGDPAVRELYDVIIQYMCDKYPMYFKLNGDGTSVHNSITKEDIPATAGDIDTRKLLHLLTRTVEEDCIIMMPDETLDDPEFGNEYYFKAGVFAFAAGFDPRDKFNKPLTSIHEPIPGYQSILRTSMNRYFQRLQPCQFVGRANFSIQAHNKFYVDDDNKGYHLSEEEVRRAIPYEDLDFDKQVHYRSERQMLTRLPKTGAIVFTIRTYLHPFSDFKSQPEEVGQRLLGALEKFPDDMAKYKGLTKLAPAAIRYLKEFL